jgi:hypothetical protein
MSEAILNHVRELAMSLSPEEQLSLIADLASKLQGQDRVPEKKPFPSMRGALKDLGPAPSAEEIDEARREAWANFPREDIAPRRSISGCL